MALDFEDGSYARAFGAPLHPDDEVDRASDELCHARSLGPATSGPTPIRSSSAVPPAVPGRFDNYVEHNSVNPRMSERTCDIGWVR